MNTEPNLEKETAPIQPKVFISYSWTSQLHQDRIRRYAERLVNSHVQVVMDIYDLKPGQDKYAFMERMVNDPSITHVLVFLDKQYAEKANKRKGGVGTESQILSQDLYTKIKQERIIPIFCEKGDDGEVVAPTYFKHIIGFDFSSLDAENDSWVQLVRTLNGKPRYVKPALGPVPAFVRNDFSQPSLPTDYAFEHLKPFYASKQSAEAIARQDFEDAAFEFLDTYRVHVSPSEQEMLKWDETVLEKLNELLPFRNQFIEWLFLEIQATTDEKKLAGTLKVLIARMIGFKGPPDDRNSWSLHRGEFDVVDIFLYEITLYLLAMLIRFERDSVLHDLLTSRYYAPIAENSHRREMCGLDELYCTAISLHNRKERLKLNRIDLLADWIKEKSIGRFATFSQLSDADGILCLAGIGLCPSMGFWYPRTFIYREYGIHDDSIFHAACYKVFAERLARIFGAIPVDMLKRKIENGLKNKERSLYGINMHFGAAINAANWGTKD